MRAFDFLDRLGVCTRLVDTTGDYGDWPSVKACLDLIGLKHIRTAAPVPNGQGISAMRAAAAAGYRFTFTVRNVSGRTFVDELPVVAQIETDFPGSVVAVEGLNEVDHQGALTWNGQTGAAAFSAYQTDLYNAVKAHPVLGSKPVLGYTDAGLRNVSCDWINVHSYPRNGNMLGTSAGTTFANCEALAPGKPKAMTETGFHDLITATPFPGTDQATQAKLVLNAMVSAPSAGFDRAWLFQLLDPGLDGATPSMENHFGLFAHGYITKPAALQASNLVKILSDAGATAATHSVADVEPTSITAGVKYKSLGRSDGATVLIAWREPDIWNESLKKPITVAALATSIAWPRSFSKFTYYKPAVKSAAVGSLPAGSTTQLSLTDVPQVLVAYP